MAPDTISPGGVARAPARLLPGRGPGDRIRQLGAPAGRDARGGAEAKAKKPEAGAAGLLAIGGIDYQADPGGAAPTDRPRLPACSWRTPSVPASRPWPARGRKCGALASSSGGLSPPARQGIDRRGADRGGRQAATWPALALLAPGHPWLLRVTGADSRVTFRPESEGPGLAVAMSSEQADSLALEPFLHSGVALVGAARKPDDFYARKTAVCPTARTAS